MFKKKIQNFINPLKTYPKNAFLFFYFFYYFFLVLVIFFIYFLVLVGQAECWLQPTGADQRGYNPGLPRLLRLTHVIVSLFDCFQWCRPVKVHRVTIDFLLKDRNGYGYRHGITSPTINGILNQNLLSAHIKWLSKY